MAAGGAEEEEEVEVEEEGLPATGQLSCNCCCFSLEVEGSITSPLARFRFLNFLLPFLRARSRAALIAKEPPGEMAPGESNPADGAGAALGDNPGLGDAAPEVASAEVPLVDFPEDVLMVRLRDFPKPDPRDAADKTSEDGAAWDLLAEGVVPAGTPELAADGKTEVAFAALPPGSTSEDLAEEVPADEGVLEDLPADFPELPEGFPFAPAAVPDPAEDPIPASVPVETLLELLPLLLSPFAF